MKNLTTALYARCAVGTDFHTAIGGRLYERVPQGTTWPYSRYSIVDIDPWRTFTEVLEDIIVQFSQFSKASSSAEVKDITSALIALYDKAMFNPTGSKVVVMEYVSGGEPRDVFDDTEGGEGQYWQTDVDFKILLSRN